MQALRRFATLVSGEPGSLVGTVLAFRGSPCPFHSWSPQAPASKWRREQLRTTLWLVPSVQVVLAGLLFAVTYALDRAAYGGRLDLPAWVNNGSATPLARS